MRTYDVDGFILGKNPSPTGGGFTVAVDDDIISYTILEPGITNNQTELLAIGCAAYLAQPGDEIRTDSQTAYHWVKSGQCKARPDLSPTARIIKKWVREKQLQVIWAPREVNRAGQYNETGLQRMPQESLDICPKLC